MERAHSDRAAVAAGEARTVSCFLRADFDGYPRRSRQGLLWLQRPAATWRPFWSVRRRGLQLPNDATVMDVREPDPAEWNVKSDLFRVIIARTPGGVLEMAVPTVDVPLVKAFLAGS
ncbi:MAG: hypothetical protein BGO38_10070 [Cellulomonas sp. 73-145]|nr:MAG: hypothetical protein BGO38_10070 [Cellulomonas sp. 73-145]